MEFDDRLIPHSNSGPPIVVDDTEAIPLAQKIMTLTGYHLPLDLSGLPFKNFVR